MADEISKAVRTQRHPGTIVGLIVGIVSFALSGATTYYNIQRIAEADQAIRHTHDVLIALDELLSTVQDAETGQRGYLLTGTEGYLEPYQSAVNGVGGRLARIAALTSDNPTQQANLPPLRRRLDAKLAELRESIELRRARGMAAALGVVATDRGKIEMDGIRSQLAVMAQEEMRLRDERITQMRNASVTAVATGIIASLIGIILTVLIFLLVRRNLRIRAKQEWLHQGQLGLAAATRGEKSVAEVADEVLVFLARYLGFQAGAVFKGEDGRFARVATLGVPPDAPVPQAFDVKEGLLGRVAAEGEPIVLADVPEDYLTIGSGFGAGKPRHLVIAPARADGVVNAVLELGFFKPADELVLAFLDEASVSIGIALRSARFRAQLQDALEETQRQAEELQTQSEELRVSNEELEEQSRALRESQVMLEQQQVELEQTNSHLEEQAQALENQRDDLERASASLELKARELEQASHYKSTFLANMSHELRTPLNSLLILSRLLAENRGENLTEEQVKFARTIEASGNDLLTLINDILDLSKIEAGHVEIQPDALSTKRLASGLRELFDPVADGKQLAFEIDLGTAPRSIVTDRLRLEQILKNLLSNAFKFTEKGSVTLSLDATGDDHVAFSVRDTGIGISPEQQARIFEAFHQADGTISRKFGGTGLGLSISRELARLLGGKLELESEPGNGSVFVLTVPVAYDPARVVPRDERAAAVPDSAAPAGAASPAAPVPHVDDDRTAITPGGRLLLIVEDDPAFASIVCDLSREKGFQCLIASTAADALALAREFKPNAVVLDLGLPDQSGLVVLDRLKHDEETRHIPVHVVSAADQSQTALSLGAVGYHPKPIPREELAGVLDGLQDKLATRLRRVLIVEDDPVQRDAVAHLLKSGDVETVAVGTAAECLEQLEQGAFDCLVLDLALPDTSGFTLLETLRDRPEDGAPPVIVYTGHDLSADDEQRLRRYSDSIIIKGAKSPERLLDEVSLFLHQVVSELPVEQRQMIQKARHRDAALEGRTILIVEDDIRNVYSLTSVLEPRGAAVEIARNGREAIDALEASATGGAPIDMVLMDVMMPVMDGLSATRAIRGDPRWSKLPILMLTAKAMPDDHQRCLEAGASDYLAKPIDVDKLLSLVRVWMPR